MIWLKRIVMTLLVMIVFIASLIAALIWTNTGLNAVLWGAEKVLPALNVGKINGTLWNGISVSDVQYQDSQMALDIKSLALKVDNKALFTPEVIVNNLSASGVNFSMPSLPPSSNSDSTPLSKIELPFPIEVNTLDLNDIHLNILGNKIAWKTFHTAATAKGNQVNLLPTLWQDITVSLAPEAKPTTVQKTPVKVAPKKKEHNKPTLILPEITLPIGVNVESFTIKNAKLLGDNPQTLKELHLSAIANDNQVAIREFMVDSTAGTVNVKGKLRLTKDYPMNLAANVAVKMKPYQGHDLALKAKGSLSDLSVTAKLTGKLSANLLANVNVMDPTFPFHASLITKHLQWPILKPEYNLNNTRIDAKGNASNIAFKVNGHATGKLFPAFGLDATGSTNMASVNLSQFTLKTLGGQVSGSLGAGWKQKVSWEGDLLLKNIQPGKQWKQAKGILNGRLVTSGGLTDQGGWFVKLPLLAINGELMHQQLHLNGQLNASDPDGKLKNIQLDTTGLKLQHGDNTVSVKGALKKEWNLSADIHAPSLSSSLPDLHGQIFGHILVAGDMMAPKLNLDLTGEGLAWQKLAKLQHFSLKGDVTPLPVLNASLSLNAKNGEYGKTVLNHLALNFNGTEAKHTLTLDVEGKPFSANMALTGDFDPKTGWTGHLENGRINTPVGVWNLNHTTPLAYDLKSAQASIGANCWQSGDSKICLVKNLKAGTSGEAQVAISNINFNLLKPYLPATLQVKGEVNANATARWAPNTDPYVNASIILPAGSVTQYSQSSDLPLQVGWNGMQVNAIMQNDQLKANWHFGLVNNGNIEGQATIDQLSSNRLLNANVKINAITLKFLDPLISAYQNVNGEVNANLTLSGDLLKPKVAGQLNVDRLVATGNNVPLQIKSGQLSAIFAGYEGTLSGVLKTPDGNLTLSGLANWADLSQWFAKMNVKGKDLPVKVPPMVSLKVSPDLTIQANANQAEIIGKVVIPSGNITVNELPKSAVKVSDDVVILNNNLQPEKKTKSSPFAIKTNVSVQLGNDVHISAFGLKGRLTGNMNVHQNNKGPQIFGEVNIKDGSYAAFGQHLLIKKGQIIFNGPVDTPYLSMEAIRNPDSIEDDVTAGVKVTGPATKPKIELYSKPAMPQQDILSYILQGKNLDNTNEQDSSDAMTSALIGLGLAQTSQLVGNVGEAVGIKDLSLSTAGAGTNSQVAISGYILPGLQLKYGVGIFNQLAEFSLKYRLMHNFYVQAVSGLDTAVDLLYNFSFN